MQSLLPLTQELLSGRPLSKDPASNRGSLALIVQRRVISFFLFFFERFYTSEMEVNYVSSSLSACLFALSGGPLGASTYVDEDLAEWEQSLRHFPGCLALSWSQFRGMQRCNTLSLWQVQDLVGPG